jgi:CHAT domain-containing protein
LKKELATAEDALEEFQLEVRRSNPRYADLKYLRPLTHQRIQQELLDADSALIEYVVGEEKSFAWFVSKNKTSYIVLPPRKELNRLVGDYRKLLAERVPALAMKRSVASLKLQGRQLYQVLLQPFDAQLASVRKLIIVPDNALAYLPFETLVADRSPTGGGKGSNTYFLVERFAVAYAPSASALAAVRAIDSHAGSRGIIAFGDPVYSGPGSEKTAGSVASRLGYYTERGFDLRGLPYTRNEVTSIGALFPVTEREVFLGANANEETVKSEVHTLRCARRSR